MELILYQRDTCHLCDLALAVLAEARTPEFDSFFIDDDDALEARYGLRVPVLRDHARGHTRAAQPDLLSRLQADAATRSDPDERPPRTMAN